MNLNKHNNHVNFHAIIFFILIFNNSINSLTMISQYDTSQDSSLFLIGRWPKGPCKAIAVEGDIAYFGNGSNLEIVDFSDLSNPKLLGQLLLPFPPVDIALSLNLVFVALGEGGLGIIDISYQNNPKILSIFDTMGEAKGLLVFEDYVFIADGNDGLRIIYALDPSDPHEISAINTDGDANGIALLGNLIILADNGPQGSRIIDVTDPFNPIEISSFGTSGDNRDVITKGNIAYIAGGYFGIDIKDISNPSHPVDIKYGTPRNDANDLAIWDNYLIAANGRNGLQIYDISTPSNPQVIGEYDTKGNALKVTVSNNLIYLADDNGDLLVFDISFPSMPAPVSIYNTGSDIPSMAFDKDYVYLISVFDGLTVVDIRNPSNPVKVGSCYYKEKKYGVVKDIEISEDYVYISDLYDGLHILNISDPFNPFKVGSLNINARDICIRGEFAFIALAFQVLVVDISNPEIPVRIDSIQTDYGSECIEIMGDYAYILGWNSVSGTLRCVDLSNPSDIKQVCELPINHTQDMATANGYLYIDYGEDVQIFDITDSQNPHLIGTLNTGEYISDIIISNENVYVANLSGLRLIDVSIPSNPLQLGYFKTDGIPLCLELTEKYVLMGETNDGLYIFQKDSIISLSKNSHNDLINSKFNIEIYPNPFKSKVMITYHLSTTEIVKIDVYNSIGQYITQLVNRREESGTHTVQWDGSEKNCGIYFIKAEVGSSITTKKCVLIN